MKTTTKALLDKLILAHTLIKMEYESETPNKTSIGRALELQSLTLIDLKEELNGSYYMTDDEKQAYYHEEEKKRLANQLNQQ
jgi:hypothetical protein